MESWSSKITTGMPLLPRLRAIPSPGWSPPITSAPTDLALIIVSFDQGDTESKLGEGTKSELTSLEVVLLQFLSGNSYYLGQKSEHASYYEQLEIALDRLKAESRGTYLFEHAMIEFVRSATDNLESSKIAAEAADEVRRQS